MSTIDVLGVPHAYDLTDPTPTPITLVFIHGWLLSRHYWQPAIELLSADYQCLAYDLRGFGDSQLYQTQGTVALSCRGYSLADYAGDLMILLKQMEFPNVWLVGHSLGGSVALWAADQMPQQIKGVICINAGGGIYLKKEFERFRSAGEQLVKMRPRWLRYVPLAELPFMQMNVGRAIARKWGRQRLVDFLTAHPDAALGTLLESTTEAEVHRLPCLVAQLQQPVYFIAGAKDTIMEPKYVHHLASFHSLFQDCGANVKEIPNCGHLAMVEQPEQVVEIIQAILSDRGIPA